MRGIPAFLLRCLAPLAAVLVGMPLLVRRFDRNSRWGDVDDALPSVPAPRPGPPAFRRVTPERERPVEQEAQPARRDRGPDTGADAHPAPPPDEAGTAAWQVPPSSGEPVPTPPSPMPGSAPRLPGRSADWMEELRRSIRQPEPASLPPATRPAERPGRRRLSPGRDAAITVGLLAVAALVGLGMTAFVVGGAGASPTPPRNAAASLDSVPPSARATAEGSPTAAASPSARVTPSPAPAAATASPTPARPAPTASLAGSHTDGVPHIEVSWPEVEGATAYEFAFERGDGAWEEVGLDSATATSTTIRIVPDRTYRFRVRAEVDDEIGEWAVGETVRLALIDEDEDGVEYEGGWEPAFHDAYVESDVRFAGSAGSSATLTFDGSGVAWRGPLGPLRGRAEVFVDGESEGEIDTGAGSFSPQNILFATSFQEAGEHELRIEVEGTAGRPAVAIDAFYLLEAPAD